MRSATPSGQQCRADDWIRTSISRFTRPAPFYVEPRRQFLQHEREESNPVDGFGGRLPLPGAHSCGDGYGRPELPLRAGRAERHRHSSSATFQYASLMNFDQLAIRTLVRRIERLPRRADRRPAEPHASLLRRAVSLALVAAMHASTQFSQVEVPPCDRGMTWSIVSSSLPGWHAAILAGVVVPLEYVAPAERHGRGRQPIVAGQRDHLRHAQPQPHRLDEQLALGRTQLRPVGPVVQPEVMPDRPREPTRSRASTARARPWRR